MGAQTNIVPFGFSTLQPILFSPLTSTSRRLRCTLDDVRHDLLVALERDDAGDLDRLEGAVVEVAT